MWLSDNDFIGFVVVLCIISAIVGGVASYAIPKLWELVKPWLHFITA